MNIIQHPSCNFNSREGHAVDMLVLHYTGMKTAEGAKAKLCDAAAKVSAHYVVEENGTICQLVAESERAWHAGVSFWRGATNINQRSIGIEIVNPGHEYGYRPFPEAQMVSVVELCKDILKRHPIPPRNVVGHSDIAPTRKQDPGELFDWARLAKEGIGLYPKVAGDRNQVTDKSSNSATCHLSPDALTSYGYDTTHLPAAITAFQRHFRPHNLSGEWDAECAQQLHYLLAASAA